MPSEPSTPRPGVILDIDGTLLDSNYLHVLAWWQGLRDAGYDQLTMAEVHQAIGIANQDIPEHLLGESSDEAVQAHSTRYQALRDQVAAFPRTAELIRACADRGLQVVIASSGEAADLEWMLPAIGSEELVAAAITADDVETAKPAPDLMVTAIQEAGLDPARTVAVGDTVWDIKAAHDAGISCIAVTSGGISRGQLLDAGADEVYISAADLLDQIDSSLLTRHRTS